MQLRCGIIYAITPDMEVKNPDPIRCRLPLLRNFEQAEALAVQEQDPFYLAAFLIQCWLGELVMRAAAANTPGKQKPERPSVPNRRILAHPRPILQPETRKALWLSPFVLLPLQRRGRFARQFPPPFPNPPRYREPLSPGDCLPPTLSPVETGASHGGQEGEIRDYDYDYDYD